MISIIDYGVGNLFSVKNALDYLKIDAVITNDKKTIENSEKIILPGVGAFPMAVKMLNHYDLFEFIKNQSKKKYILGICLGMQLLFDYSLENEKLNGMGLISGYINEILKNDIAENHYKIPHMGWNELHIKNKCALTENLNEHSFVYYVHSFKANTDDKYISTYSDYSEKIPGIVFNNNIFGCQFHPEKSGEVGLKILKNFNKLI